jgi:glycosyltransferase involved in cell wall biosynthesis
MEGWPIHVVPNVLDTELFQPTDRRRARRDFDLPVDSRVVLFGAVLALKERRKGLDLLLESLHRLDPRQPVQGVIFGEDEPSEHPPAGVPLRWMGRIDDDRALARLYGAADVVAVPSRQEAFGQTASEAHACGTPVVAFDATGLKDIVVHRETGYLAEAFSAVDFARGLRWVLDDESRRQSLAARARQRSIELWSPGVVVEQYREVYRTAITDR